MTNLLQGIALTAITLATVLVLFEVQMRLTETDAHPNGKAAHRFARSIVGFLLERFPAGFDTARSH